jgi:uncharacterized protein with NRDE domain
MCVAFLFLGDPDPDEDALKSPYVFVLAVNRDESYERCATTRRDATTRGGGDVALTTRKHPIDRSDRVVPRVRPSVRPSDARPPSFPSLLLRRPTQQMHFWPDHADVLAGRDENAKGTWMGITKTGRVAVVTNYHEKEEETSPMPRPPGDTPPSRGELPVKFLDGDDAPVDFLRALEKSGVVETYDGFSLIVGDARTGEFACLSNRGDDAGTATPLAAKPSAECADEDVGGAVYGLSNAALDAPWPKIANGKKAMEEEMARVNRAWHVFGPKSEVRRETARRALPFARYPPHDMPRHRI